MLFILFAASPACAYSGNNVLDSCPNAPPPITNPDSVPPMLDYAQCIGYLMGMNDMAVILQQVLEKKAYCMPGENGIKTRELILVFTQWLTEHPTELNKPAQVLFLKAIGFSVSPVC